MSDWIETAKVGDKVVCIDITPLAEGVDTGLILGKVYEIIDIRSGIGRLPNGDIREEVVLELAGYTHPRIKRLGNAIGAFRFRPVEPRKTDISWAHEILKKADKPFKECV